jgi:hypothetical protein
LLRCGNHTAAVSFLPRETFGRHWQQVSALSISTRPLSVFAETRAGLEGEANRTGMAIDKGMKNIGHERARKGRQAAPDWASGLRRLYDSVVDEPLPDSFAQLLDKLDKTDG